MRRSRRYDAPEDLAPAERSLLLLRGLDSASHNYVAAKTNVRNSFASVILIDKNM
jgi:hypothetical protein